MTEVALTAKPFQRMEMIIRTIFSYYELYKESYRDLLTNVSTKKLELRIANGKSHLKNLMKFKAEGPEEIMEVFAKGKVNQYIPIASGILFAESLQQINDE